ncbi:Phosphonopyruvate decarboxylase [Folsomia candida]|uniref:Phosphonopyruvate decarboxylase n=1 Tax=Folsomia candida TaxID=158441 RepID=A0A226EMW3_FOLCA|nr:Phosphonopyruvate decarboxylase [Folsomia candida]
MMNSIRASLRTIPIFHEVPRRRVSYSITNKTKSGPFCSNKSLCTSWSRELSSTNIPSPEEQYEEQRKRNTEYGVLTELVRDFLTPSAFYNAIREIGIDHFTGVPDSLLKGAALSIATGYHLATGKASLVYMQNSGLGNAINPLVSLCARDVYSIPILMLIGWRGEPGKRDEPQHRVQGQVTPGILAALSIPFQPLPDYIEGAQQALYTAKKHMERTQTPYALLVKRQTFTPYKMQRKTILDETDRCRMGREDAVQAFLEAIHDRDIVISSTGMASRELFELRKLREEGHEKDFLNVGSMGHASSIALGIALQKINRRVFILDGDGALIMHCGSLATIAQMAPPNLHHIVLNNGAHDSVGGQPTAASNENFSIPGIAKAVGYKQVAFLQTQVATTKEEIIRAISSIPLSNDQGPTLIEVKVARGSRKDLGRPTRTPVQNKIDFMHFLAINS